jgi:hypothetical protein
MNDKDKNKIIGFVSNAIDGCLLNYTQIVKKDILEIKISSPNCSKEITCSFKIRNGTIYFYSSNKRYEEATEKLFFDEMMSQAQDELYGIK